MAARATAVSKLLLRSIQRAARLYSTAASIRVALAQLPGYLEFTAHCQVKTAIQTADINKLYIKKSLLAQAGNPEFG